MKIKLLDSTPLYFADLICLIGILFIMGFFAYVSPYLFLGVRDYQVPAFVIAFSHWLKHHHNLIFELLSTVWFLPMAVLAFGFYSVASKIGALLEDNEADLAQQSKGLSFKTKAAIFLFIAVLLIFGVSTEYCVTHLFVE